MHASSARSWVHEWFHSKQDATGDYRFCRVCWDELPAISELQKAMLEPAPLSVQYSGVVKAERSSTSGMVNHMKQQHKELLPEELQQEASSGCRPMKVDPEVSRKWSEHMCLRALVPVRTVEHARKVFSSLPGRTALSEQVSQQIKDIRAEVESVVQEAADQSCRFALQADTWKSRLVKRDHYLAVILTWVGPDSVHHSACIDVSEMTPPRNGAKYADMLGQALDKVGLTPEHLVAAVSDHEGAIRVGMRSLCQDGAIGCGCHLTQLLFKHALPSRRQGFASNGALEQLEPCLCCVRFIAGSFACTSIPKKLS